MIKHELDQLIICKKCHTLHEKFPLEDKEKALCSKCNVVLYQRDDNMIEKTLALVITAGISFFIAFQFSIITINIQGMEQSLTLSSLFTVLAEHEQYIVGIMFFFLIILFPLIILISMFSLLLLMKWKSSPYLTRRLLILLAYLRPWSMIDIFFISLLVALVKLLSYANIEFGVAFIALLFTLILDIIITKSLSFYELWEAHKKIYGETDE